MQTELECMSCFMKQALATARICSDDPELHRLIVCETGKLLAEFDLKLSPPENAVALYQQIAELSGIPDPFFDLKKESNDLAVSLRKDVRDRIRCADDPLYAAVRYAIAGNIIDYGAQHEFDAIQTLSRCLEDDLCIDDYGTLKDDVKGTIGKKILYLADNCGEIVFDTLLIEQLQNHGHSVTLVVRGKEILNDVTMREAHAVGIDTACSIITNGTSCPGTPLGSSSEELKQAFAGADLIISKGQGNFETLSDVEGPLYFLLTVKCPVVANHITCLQNISAGKLQGHGEMVLMKREEQDAYDSD